MSLRINSLPSSDPNKFGEFYQNKDGVAISNGGSDVSFTVSGAGTTAWNGTYTYGGVSGGRPYYQLEEGKYLYCVVGSGDGKDYYYLGATLDDEETYYYYATTYGFPQFVEWNAEEGDLGELPAPTVSINHI